jgi:carbon storage regulator
MLVLSRRVDEKILITAGDQVIVVTLVDVRGEKVRIGIDAERSVSVMRAELLERKPEGRGPR